MKILCVADHRSPIVYSTGIKKRFNDVDLILGAGDLPLDYYGYIVSSLNKKLYFVFGNHNLKHYNRFTGGNNPYSFEPAGIKEHNFGSIFLSEKVIRDKKSGLIIAGMGGCFKYNNGENQYSEIQMYIKLFKLIPKLMWNKIFHGKYLDVFLTHTPPLGYNDRKDICHRGFKSFLWFLEKFKPKYMIHGHIHLYDRNENKKVIYKNTEIINVYDYFVLDIEV